MKIRNRVKTSIAKDLIAVPVIDRNRRPPLVGFHRPASSCFSHELVLGQATMGVRVHGLGAGMDILDKAETKGPSTVLVALELRDGRLSSVGVVEPDDAGTARPSTGLILDLGLLHLTDCREQLD
jgi:hypothetical protein